MPFGELVLPDEDQTRRAFFEDETISKPRCVESCWTSCGPLECQTDATELAASPEPAGRASRFLDRLGSMAASSWRTCSTAPGLLIRTLPARLIGRMCSRLFRQYETRCSGSHKILAMSPGVTIESIEMGIVASPFVWNATMIDWLSAEHYGSTPGAS